MRKHTIIHVTHEAVHKVGGIGTVLHGLLTSKKYNDAVGRSILLGPLFDIGAAPTSAQRLGPNGHVVYSSMDGIYDSPYGKAFQRIEKKYSVRIVYGRRAADYAPQTSTKGQSLQMKVQLEEESSSTVVNPEVLLIETSMTNQVKENDFKYRLYEKFGLESNRYESNGEYEQYLRIAEPGYEALKAILSPACALETTGKMPVPQGSGSRFVLSHEFMGMPLVLKILLEEDESFSTVFYAHEVAPIRRIVEESFGHDTMFYNVLEKASQEGKCVEDVFGTQDDYFEHALVEKSKLCDNIFAVGDYTRKEMIFLWPTACSSSHRPIAEQSSKGETASSRLSCQSANTGSSSAPRSENPQSHKPPRVDLVYNGVPAFKISLEEKLESKRKLQDYAEALLGYKPDYIFTHVTRLVISKGLWRDFRVLEHLDAMFQSPSRSVRSASFEEGKRGVFFILSSQAGTRSPADVLRMEKEYGWPAEHHLGYPDLVHDEAPFNVAVQKFNKRAYAIKAVFVNQFGWSQELCGRRMSPEMEFMDIRKGTDVEFGQSIYEPFGISQLEPLSFGAICVVSNVCGCYGFAKKVVGDKDVPNIVVADYTNLNELSLEISSSIERMLRLGVKERDSLEGAISRGVAEKIMERLPRSEEAMSSMITEGYGIASQMSWEVVVADYFLPGLEQAAK